METQREVRVPDCAPQQEVQEKDLREVQEEARKEEMLEEVHHLRSEEVRPMAADIRRADLRPAEDLLASGEVPKSSEEPSFLKEKPRRAGYNFLREVQARRWGEDLQEAEVLLP